MNSKAFSNNPNCGIAGLEDKDEFKSENEDNVPNYIDCTMVNAEEKKKKDSLKSYGKCNCMIM